MVIQWFPGHMAKAQREMSEKLKAVDMIIELRDARIPDASRNPVLDQMDKSKPRLIILTKKDKADQNETTLWLEQLNLTQKALAFDLNTDRLINPITSACLALMSEKHERLKRRGINPRAIRAMVVGIPNVGKSTLINRLTKKKVVQTANRPGVTRSLKLIIVNDDLQLIDTPGVLWPKFDDKMIGLYLGLTGAISDDVIPTDEIAVFGLTRLLEAYPERLIKRYDIELDNDPYVVLQRIAVKRGYLLANGPDQKRTIDMLIKEIRDDQFGPITWQIFHE